MFIPKLGGPAVLFRFAELRPEALRPCLSKGLPFSKSIFIFSYYIGNLVKNI
jgi:hypothetical protein